MPQRASARKVTCEDCYFARNVLCALERTQTCAAFRPHRPEGLRPPRQLRFAFRAEGTGRPTWAFPTADEQAALHA